MNIILRATRLLVIQRGFFIVAGLLIVCLIWAGPSDGQGQRLTISEFRGLMSTVAEGWNSGDARKSANCFAEDAIYTEPPDKQVYFGRESLFQFFGGDKKPDRPMRMEWHHISFDEESQIGFGEYTFQMNNRYHGIVVVKLRSGKISNWREYQYKSGLTWLEFNRLNPF